MKKFTTLDHSKRTSPLLKKILLDEMILDKENLKILFTISMVLSKFHQKLMVHCTVTVISSKADRFAATLLPSIIISKTRQVWLFSKRREEEDLNQKYRKLWSKCRKRRRLWCRLVRTPNGWRSDTIFTLTLILFLFKNKLNEVFLDFVSLGH